MSELRNNKENKELDMKSKARVEQQISKLICFQPLFGTVFLFLNKRIENSIPTMAVGVIRKVDIALFFNSSFVDKMTDSELRAVLKHEALHILLHHISRTQKNEYNPGLFNVAADMVINQNIEGLPEGGIYPETYGFERGESSDLYYKLLKKKVDESDDGILRDGNGNGLDGDGIDERIRVCTVGNGLNIVNSTPWDDLPITLFCPDPEPHTSIGSCPADYLMPIQAAKSQIMRDTLDSLGHAIFPRMGIVEGQVNIDDVLNTDIGQPIRMRAPGMVQPFSVPFVGKEAFPVLSYLDEAKENRTGVSKASAGLNAEALQSTTSAAVSATMSGAQGRVELICRHFADGMKDLFKLVNSLVIKHQEGQDMMRLNNEFIPVDPRYWDADKDMVVNVGISKNSDEEKFQVLTALSQKQEQIMQTLGPNNPLVNLQQYANTLTKMIEMAGFKDATTFINTTVPPMPPQPQEPAKPSPEEMLAQAEAMKAQNLAQKAIIDAETDRMKIIMDDDRNRDEHEADLKLKIAELQAKYGAQINVAEINAIMERDREAIRQLAKSQSQGMFTNGNDQPIG